MIALLTLIAAGQIATPPTPRDDFQIMTSPAFEAFARRTDAICPARRLRNATPADLDYAQERFEDTLAHRQRRRLAAADPGVRGCANRDGGLSCPAQHKLAAMIRLGMLDSFARSACRMSN